MSTHCVYHTRAVSRHIRRNAAFERGGRVAFLARPGVDYVRTLLGTWEAGGIAVPLCVSHPPDELSYAITESDACVVTSSGVDFGARLQPIAASP